MTMKVILQSIILILAATDPTALSRQVKDARWGDAISVEGLPFCALILSNVYDKRQKERTVDILMEPHQVNEDNLRLLFRSLSERFPDDLTFKAWVNTNVKQLAMLATGMGGSGPAQGKRALQLAYYRRTEKEELFRYNPNYPKAGEKTVIIRGKED